MREFLHAKIHRATVTQAEPEYIGSVTIDEALLEKTGLLPNQKVLISSLTSGNRLETYIIPGEKNSGVICMNGPVSCLIKKGEMVVIMGFEITDKPIEPKVVLVDEKNIFVKYL